MVWQIAHGTRLLGKHHITTGEHNLIFELDGRPALEVLLEDLPPALHQSLPQLGGHCLSAL